MFTGLIEHRGRIVSADPDGVGGLRLRVAAASAVAGGIVPKDSISINGVCLTAVEIDGENVRFDVVPETLSRSTLANVRAGDDVNVELSLRVGDKLGGHIVYGHVDAKVQVLGKEPEGRGFRLRVARPAELARYIVEKGCIAVDGVSLTVAAVVTDDFRIAVIPETAERTTLGARVRGDYVNLEIDPIARYALAGLEPYEETGVRSDELAWAYEI